MKIKSLLAEAIAVGLSLLAAGHRWGDSSHAIGLVSAGGGKVRHASMFEAGWPRYMQITTATVLPPFRGDARVVLEGDGAPAYRLYYSEPIVNLGLKQIPRFENDTLMGLAPGDRIALWVEMTPGPGRAEAHAAGPGGHPANPEAGGGIRLTFYDVKNDAPVLSVPFVFKGKGEGHGTHENPREKH